VSLTDRLIAGLRTIVLIDERTKLTVETLKALKAKTEAGMADHEKRLIRLETIVEIARPDGAVLRIGRTENPEPNAR
jgi:hypothetical protein